MNEMVQKYLERGEPNYGVIKVFHSVLFIKPLYFQGKVV